MTVIEDMEKIIKFLIQFKGNEFGDAFLYGKDIQEGTGLTPIEINGAIQIASQRDWVKAFDREIPPFTFGTVSLTQAGRFVNESRN